MADRLDIPGLKTIRQMRDENPRMLLRSFIGKHCILRRTIENYGGTRIEQGEVVRIEGTYNGNMSIEVVAVEPGKTRGRYASGIPQFYMYYQGDQPLPAIVEQLRSQRPPTWTCKCGAVAHRPTHFRGNCSLGCWIKLNDEKVREIVRSYYGSRAAKAAIEQMEPEAKDVEPGAAAHPTPTPAQDRT